MLLYFYLFAPLLFLSGDASSIRGRNNKNELVPFGSSELGTQGKENKLRTLDGEPFLVKLRMSSDAKQTKERDKKRQRFVKKRVSKQKHLKKKHRARRDLIAPKSKHIRVEKTHSWENPQADNATDEQLKDFTSNRVEVLKALSTFSKKKENGYFKDKQKNGTQKGKHGTGSNLNHPKHRPSDHELHVKMTYPSTPKTDRRKYTHKDLIADRKRLEQKINYIKNMLSVNETTTDDPIRIRRRSESDRTANKIAKMFLTLSAMNGLQDRRKSKCKYGEEDEEEDRLQDVWEKERRHNPMQRTSSSNEERYKVKKWIEFMKNKRSSGKTCPCMTSERDDNDDFPLEQKLPKDYFLMERSRSSEESSEICRDPYCCRDKLMEQHKKRIKGQEDQDKPKEKNGKKKLELPLNDLDMYRSRAKQILQNAEEILDKIKYEEERRLSAPNILMNQLKELTSRIQSDPRSNENDLIRKIQKNLGWSSLSKSKESPDSNGFVDNFKSYILDPYEKAKALTDESAKMLSSYLLRNLGKLEESSEEQEPDQSDHVYFGRIQTKEDDKLMAASLAKEADLLSKNKEELQNWEDTISKIMTGAEEAVQTEPESANNREVFKNRMEDIIKEQQKKVTDYEISHQNSQETDDQTANLQQKEEIVSGNPQNPSEISENVKDGSNTNQQEEVKSAQIENLSERSEDDKANEGNRNGNQQEEAKSLNIENPSEISEKEQTAEELIKSQKTQDNYHQTIGRPEKTKNDRNVKKLEEVKSSNPENSSEGLEENKDDITANQQKEVELVNPENQRDETEERKGDRNAQQQEEVISENPETPIEGLEENRANGSANEQEEVKSADAENSNEDSENDKNDPIATLKEEVKSVNPDNSSEQAEDKDERNAQQQEEVLSENLENSRKESEDKDGQNANRQEEVKSAKPENSNDGTKEDKDDPTANQEEEVKSTKPENSRKGSEEDNDDPTVNQEEEAKSTKPENSREDSEEDKDDQNANRQEEVKSEKPENSNDGTKEDKDDPTANQEEEVKSANLENSREDSEEDNGDPTVNQEEEAKSTKPENSREDSEEDKDGQNANRQEEVKSEKPENSNDGTKEDKDDPTANQEEVESANPESEQLSIQLGPNDPEAETADAHKTQESVEKNIEPKKSSHLEKDNPEDLGSEILDVIMKTISENSDSVGNERETENSQENPQTDREEEENEDRVAESPKTISEMQDNNLSSSHLADDYDVLDETTESGENQAENQNETILQEQKPLEMREESDSEDKYRKDNHELSNPSERHKETEKGSQNVKEKQTELEEITKEPGNLDMFLENVNPNEDNLKPKQDVQQYQTDDEAETRHQEDKPEVAKSETGTISDYEKDDEPLESTLKEEEVPHHFRYMDEADEGTNYFIQAKNTENEDNESREDVSNETPLREVMENRETHKDETEKAEEDNDEPSDKDETNLEMAKETDLKKMNDDDVEPNETEVPETANETPQENLKEEESQEDKTVSQKFNLNEDENDDAQNSDESLEKARDEENSYEDDENNQKSINPDRNPENERANEDDETSEALNRKNTDEEEDPVRDKKPSEEATLRSALGDQTEEEALSGGEKEESDESSEENKSGETLKDASEHINQENPTVLKSANQDENGETLKQFFGEEDQKSRENQAEESEGSETGSRTTLTGQNNQDESEKYSKTASSIENVDKTEESLEVDLADVETVEPKENESPQTEKNGETVRTSLDDPKTEQMENLEEDEETPLRSALVDQTEGEVENTPNSQSVEETSEERTEDIRADITHDADNQLYLENKHEIPLKSDKSGDSLEGGSYEENVGANLIVENEETPLRKSNSEQNRFPIGKPQHKLKIPKSIGQIMKDLNGKDDVISVQNLNPDKIDDIIDKIDEAEQQNLLEDPVDCRKECACADEMNTRSRNIGRYEIAKDFLHWMKELQLNRVFSDD